MARFDNAIALAHRLIKKNGQRVTWRNYTDTAAADPNKPWEGSASGGAYTDYTVMIAFVPNESRRDRVFYDYLPDTNVQTGRLAGLMGAVAFSPSARDIIVRNGKEIRIKNLDNVMPNDQVVLWVAELEQ